MENNDNEIRFPKGISNDKGEEAINFENVYGPGLKDIRNISEENIIKTPINTGESLKEISSKFLAELSKVSQNTVEVDQCLANIYTVDDQGQLARPRMVLMIDKDTRLPIDYSLTYEKLDE